MSSGRGPVSHTIVAITGRATETCSSQMARPTSRSSIRPAAWCVGRYCGGGRPRSTGRPTMAKSLWANPEGMSASTQRVARYGSGSPHRVSVVFSDCPPAKFFCANLIRAEWSSSVQTATSSGNSEISTTLGAQSTCLSERPWRNRAARSTIVGRRKRRTGDRLRWPIHRLPDGSAGNAGERSQGRTSVQFARQFS
jgi:hypothetical protein